MNRPRLNTRPATRRRRSWLPSLEEVERRELLSGAPVYVLGGGNLWLETPGWQTSATGRTFIDSNVVSFVPAGAGDVYVLGSNSDLWLEGPNWQNAGRTFIDSNVEAFAGVGASDPFAPHGYGDLYVLGSDANLWLEGPGWQSAGRIPVDSKVKAFAPIPDGTGDLYVLGSDDNLWREAPGWQSSGRTFIDANVYSFAADPNAPDYVYVEGTDYNLWYETPGWQTSVSGRAFIDSNVMSFAPEPNAPGYVYVEGRDETLWLEYAGWQTYGRTFIDDDVASFAPDPNEVGYLYVGLMDGTLWVEPNYWATVGYGCTFIDANVTSFAGEAPFNPAAAAGYSPAPASASLFSPSNGDQPSYLDVEQGGLNDCWLMASLAEVAARDPQIIRNMFTYDGTTVDNGATVGLYTVRFYTINDVAIYVQVDTELPAGGGVYAHVNNALGTQALWVALAEKAYIEASSLGCVDTDVEYLDSYGGAVNSDGGFPGWALIGITGSFAKGYGIDPSNIAAAWNSGNLIALTTPASPPSSFIVGGHCYAVVGYEDSGGESYFELFNAWGTDSAGWAPGHDGKIYGLFWAPAAFIEQNFSMQTFGTGASDVHDVNEPVEALIESATGTGGYAQNGTIHLSRYSPGGGVANAETVAVRGGNGGYSSATGYTRPAQATAIGTDPGDASDSGDVNNTTASNVNGPAGPMVISVTGPTFTRIRSFYRKFWMGV